MSHEREDLEEADAELAALLRAALRARTPPGLSALQRGQLTDTGAGIPRPGRVKWLVAAAAVCAALLTGYGGKLELARRERLAERQAAAAAREAAHAREDAQRAAQASAQRAAREAEQRMERERASCAAEAAAASRAASAASVAMQRPHASRAHKAAAGTSERSRARPSASGRGKASGACDGNDPLCGL